MRIPVNIATDVTVGAGVHTGCMPPRPPEPTFSVEMVANQAWPPGLATASHRISRTVTHRAQGIVQGGHDQGPLLMHLTPTLPANILLPADIVGSSRKVAVEASTVTLDGAPAGAAGTVPTAMPMLCCSFPVSVPATFPVANMLNTVTVGLVPKDLVKAVLAYAAEVVVNFAVGRLFKGPKPAWEERGWITAAEANALMVVRMRESLYGGFAAFIAPPGPKEVQKSFSEGTPAGAGGALTKWALTQAAGLAVEAIASESPTYKAEMGLPFAKVAFGHDAGAGGETFDLTAGPYRLNYWSTGAGRSGTRHFLSGREL